MKKVLLIFGIFVLFTTPVYARRGCCSHHGGVAGCNANGRQVCNDGTLSPSCTCTPTYIYGCTDRKATNYNSNANKDDGSCTYPEPVKGCTDKKATNYNKEAEADDGSCTYPEPSPSPSEQHESVTTINTTQNNSNNEEDDEDNSVAGVVGTLLLASGGYYIYKKKRG